MSRPSVELTLLPSDKFDRGDKGNGEDVAARPEKMRESAAEDGGLVLTDTAIVGARSEKHGVEFVLSTPIAGDARCNACVGAAVRGRGGDAL